MCYLLSMNCCRGFLASLVCAALVACTESAAPDSGLVTHIEQASLSLDGSLQVSFTITNRSSRAEDVPACDGQASPNFQRLGSRWEDVGGSLCSTIYSAAPVSLASGASMRGSAGICCVTPGTYRLVVAYARDGSPSATSESFTVP